ncbi:MAG: hypothetical protein R2818_05625 [Flavobacteriales bacterium]
MRSILLSVISLLTIQATAQYGTFDASAVKAGKSTTLIVVMDAGDSPYNQNLMNAVKGEWKYTAAFDFMTTAEFAAQPISPDRTYLLKTRKTDPVKFEATFLTLIKGWKPKKGDVMEMKDNAFTSIPAEHELAFIQIDPTAINDKGMGNMLMIYVKHLQDYLALVEKGKITDKATADRTYSGRTRLIRDTELWMAQEHLDKSIPDASKLKEFYTAPCQVMALSQLPSAIAKQKSAVTVSDVILTGDHKNKHCFKRVFNSGTGELMYQNDDAAIYGKKEGFIEEDLKAMERAR